jgi:hypothetical protein
MPQAANIVLADGQLTPVNHTFAVEQATPALSTFVDRAVTTALGFRRMALSTKFASGQAANAVNRSGMRFEVPVTNTVGNLTTVVYILRANLDLILPTACTDAERKDLYAYVQSALANPSVKAALRDYDPFY